LDLPARWLAEQLTVIGIVSSKVVGVNCKLPLWYDIPKADHSSVTVKNWCFRICSKEIAIKSWFILVAL
jgi:hypothetical protein